MQLVRRPDALALHRLRHPVGAVREHAIHPASRAVFAVGAWSSRPAARQSPTLPAATGDLRLLPLPGRAAAARGARARAGLGGALRALRDGSARRARIRVRHNLERPAAGGVGAVGGRGAEARPRGRRRVRRRLRDRALVAPPAQPGRRRALDRRHRRHPADAPRAGAGRAPAVRLRRDRPARAARASSARAAWSSSTRTRSARRPRSSPTASTRRTCSARWLRERGIGRAGRVRARSASTSRRSGRPARRPIVDVVSVGADPHRDFELLLVGRTGDARDELPRRDDGATARARSPAGRPTSRSRPTCRSTRCAGGSSEPASSPFPSATTATRGRRRCSSRRWRSPSRSSSPGRRRSRRGTGSRTATTCGSSLRGTAAPSAERWPSCSRDGAGPGARRAGARDRRAGAHLGALRGAARCAPRTPRSRGRPRRRTAGYRPLSCAPGRSESARLALGLGLLLVLLRGDPYVASDQGSSSASRGGCSTATRLYADVFDNKDPLFFYTYAGALWVGGWRGPFLLDAVWLGVAGSRRCAARSRARSAAFSSGRELLRVSRWHWPQVGTSWACRCSRRLRSPRSRRGSGFAGDSPGPVPPLLRSCSSSSTWRPSRWCRSARCSCSASRSALGGARLHVEPLGLGGALAAAAAILGLRGELRVVSRGDRVQRPLLERAHGRRRDGRSRAGAPLGRVELLLPRRSLAGAPRCSRSRWRSA